MNKSIIIKIKRYQTVYSVYQRIVLSFPNQEFHSVVARLGRSLSIPWIQKEKNIKTPKLIRAPRVGLAGAPAGILSQAHWTSLEQLVWGLLTKDVTSTGSRAG